MQIVLARLDDDVEIVKLGRIDIGEPHKFRPIKRPVSLMWLNDGTAEDVAKAKSFATKNGYAVLCYEQTTDPLGRARVDIMKASNR